MYRLVAYFFFLFFVASPVAAEEWHGITPGNSTRNEVIREFGECPAPATRCEFNLPTEDVYVTLSGPKACPDVPQGTVLLIERELVAHQSFASLNFDRRRFKKFDPTWPRRIGYQGYIDDKAGLLLKAFNNNLFQITYIPPLTARKFCSTFYSNPKRFIETYVEHAPTVDIDCPRRLLTVGKPLNLRAEYERGLSIVLTWYLNETEIADGQGRRKITVATSGLEGRTITISVERADSRGFISFDSCKVTFEARENR